MASRAPRTEVDPERRALSVMATAGYSDTPLARKIGIKAGHRVALLHRPSGWMLADLAEDVELVGRRTAGCGCHGGLLPGPRRSGRRGRRVWSDDLADAAMLWIAWPRKAAGHPSDIAENDLRDLFLPLGLVDVKVAALGEDWSGLKLVRRLENRRH